MDLSDDELLRLVKLEKLNSIGFELDYELVGERERALNYYKGEMPDVPALPNRSKAVSSDIADAVETILPDLMEIFTGGTDVAAFTPTKPGDEQRAQQETDYVNHVVFEENPGWMLLYTFFKDALIEKTGILTAFWEKKYKTSEEYFEGKTVLEMALASQAGEIADAKPYPGDGGSPPSPDGSGATGQLYNFTLRQTKENAGVCIRAITPQDFTVAADTVNLNDATYCAFRSRPRAQELIDEGIDKSIVDRIPAVRRIGPDATNDLARDTAGESSTATSGTSEQGDLRQVEIVTHYLRTSVDESGELKIVQIRTGVDESVLIDKELTPRMPFCVVTPFITTHRFYGQSLADRLSEIQRIKTALMRMLLDSGYFALNQRLEVAMDQSNAFTISDLLRNEPGVPVRSKSGTAVRAISAGGLGFDAAGALEYFSTVGEGRSGVVRNAQGLNPNTLHDTATGAMQLMGMAQKRVRMVARVFAETGMKDLFRLVHAITRENASEPQIARLRGQWIPVNPSTWAERNDMTIEVGLGASGREHDAQMMAQVLQTTQSVITMQSGVSGPLVTAANAYQVLKTAYEKLGIKQPERFLTDPATVPPQQQQQQAPDPKMMAIQLQHQREMAQQQAELQLKQQQMQIDFALKKYEIDSNVKARLQTAVIGAHPVPALHDPVPLHIGAP